MKPPVQAAGYLFYSTDQGIQGEVSDVSADEGGNVYVAAGSMVYAKARADQDFKAIDPQAALTANCWDASQIDNKTPPGPPRVCPVISVAGAAPGHAVLGLKGVGVDYDYDAPWALDSGGADLVSFDGTTLHKERHVFLASPPGVICEHWANPPANTECLETWIDSTWMSGRKTDPVIFTERQIVSCGGMIARSRPCGSLRGTSRSGFASLRSGRHARNV